MVPPVAVNVVDEPVQMLTPEPALTVGSGLTVTVTLAVLEQPVCIGACYRISSGYCRICYRAAHVVQDKPVDGDQL